MPACILRFPYALVFAEPPECSYVLTIVCSGGRRTFSDARGRVICGRPISRGMPMAIRRGASACGMPMAIWHGASAAPCGQKRPHSVTFAAFVFLRLGVCRENTCSRACAFDYLSKRIMNRGDFVQFASRSPLLPRSSKRPLRLACVALSCERLFRLVHVVLISRVPLCSRAPSPCPYRRAPRVRSPASAYPPRVSPLRHVSHILYVPPVPLASAHLGWPAPGRGFSSKVFSRLLPIICDVGCGLPASADPSLSRSQNDGWHPRFLVPSNGKYATLTFNGFRGLAGTFVCL